MIDEKKYVKIISDTVKQASEPVQSEVLNQDITVTENGVYRADAGYTGLGTVTVNVQPKLVMQFNKNVTNTLTSPTEFIDLTGIEDVGVYALAYKYYSTPSIPETINGLNGLIRISGAFACYHLFADNLGIKHCTLSNLKVISGLYACNSMFYGCENLEEADVGGIEEISGENSCGYMYYKCKKISSVSFDNLKTCSGLRCLSNAFMSCSSLTSLSFPALKSNSFGTEITQFTSMLSNVTGCTVHFPSNLQAVIGEWGAVQNGFGGNNTTVLFDLPATE